MYVCMYVGIHSRIHKDIDTSDNRDRLNSQRYALVQAVVTTQLCHHTCHLPQRQTVCQKSQTGDLAVCGLLLPLCRFIVVGFGVVSLVPHCFLQLPYVSIGRWIALFLVPGCCQEYSFFSA